jgi:hypothetical protein
LLTASTIVVGREPVLEGDLDDGLHPLIVGVRFLEWAVDVVSAGAIGPKTSFCRLT